MTISQIFSFTMRHLFSPSDGFIAKRKKFSSFQNFVENNMNFPFLFTFREEQKKLSLEIHRKLPLISLPPVKSPPLTYTPPLPSLISHPSPHLYPNPPPPPLNPHPPPPPPLTGYRPISPKTKKTYPSVSLPLAFLFLFWDRNSVLHL